jgi:ligand-binding sensor domain-containing protein/signal transduction histidine kinase
MNVASFRSGCRRQILLAAAQLFLLLPAAVRGQIKPAAPAYLVSAWQMEQGLPENIVNAVAQTPDGYLWCGTTRGLARFDGVRFEVFNETSTPILGNNNIRQLLVDHQGTLWIAVSGGSLVRFEAGQFRAYSPPPRESAGRTFIRIAEDYAGKLWLTAEDGALFCFAGRKFTQVSAAWDPANTNFYHIHMDARQQPWVGTRNGLARIEDNQFVPVLNGKPRQYTALCASRSGGFWIRNSGRVQLWQDGQWLADAGEADWDGRDVDTSLEDRNGGLWVGLLGQGLWHYTTNLPPEHLTTDNGLGSDLIRSIFEDTEGDLWIGTRAGGLNRLRPALFKTLGKKDGLASDQITAICEGQAGELWVGTDGEGMDRVAADGITHFGKNEGLAGLYVRSLLCDRQGNLWSGSWAGGLGLLATNHFEPVKDFSGPKVAITSLFEDSRSNLWIGQRTLNKLFHLADGKTANAINLSNALPSMDITTIAEDRAESLWVGSQNSGLFRWHAGTCRQFTRADGLPNNNIRALFADPDGALWIGTMDGGLCRFKNDKFATCNVKNGLVDNVINYIADDGRGNFWFSSFHGIFHAEKSTLDQFMDGKRNQIECVAYGKSDGLPTIECQGGFQPAGCRTRDGRLWFPTIKGLVSVDPAAVNTPTNPPPVLIEGFYVDDQLFADRTESANYKNIQIPPGRHRFEFRYTGLCFAAPENLRFKTKLEGLDAQWIDAGESRTAFYSPLPPGDYRFCVLACNQAGVWNETGAALSFQVLPHVWQTWWFTAGTTTFAALALGTLIFYTARSRYKRRLARLETQLSVERERARIARDIHDGVGANLTEIAWLADVAEKDAADPDEVRTQARKISGTARETVQQFDEIVWAVLPANDTLASLVKYLGRRVDEWFENSPTRCWFTAPRELPDLVVPAEIRHSFYLACKEALHNANKHARATEVRVQISIAGGTLQVDIADNGCGFDPAAQAEGNGLRNLRQRFEKLGGRLELSSRRGEGTKIRMVIQLPAAKTLS